jgi:adhesin transport system membrane fusion protein
MARGTKRKDLEFASEIAAATHRGPPRASFLLLVTIALLLGSFLTWAKFATIDEVARGSGQVIPSDKTQVIQSLEGGIVKQILVRNGEKIAKGQILIRIDDIKFSSNLGELQAKQNKLRAQVIRLKAELKGLVDEALSFPADLVKAAPDVIVNEKRLYGAKLNIQRNRIIILATRRQQRRQELTEANAELKNLRSKLKLAVREFDLKAPLAKKGIVPKTDVLRLEREIVDIKAKIEANQLAVPRLNSAIKEATAQIGEQRLLFHKTAQTELSDRISELLGVNETIKAAKDSVKRADIRSPVDGIINKLNVNTVGGVVRAGETIIEIVPLQSALQIEARIKPSDIAFVHLKQKAVVKITAFDFSIFGGLDGTVENISPDSVYDENAKASFYIVTIRTDKSSLSKGDKVMPIIPGMVASVDILTGKKSILDFILKPIQKARYEALRER